MLEWGSESHSQESLVEANHTCVGMASRHAHCQALEKALRHRDVGSSQLENTRQERQEDFGRV